MVSNVNELDERSRLVNVAHSKMKLLKRVLALGGDYLCVLCRQFVSSHAKVSNKTQQNLPHPKFATITSLRERRAARVNLTSCMRGLDGAHNFTERMISQ
jgi:hypothetical protein